MAVLLGLLATVVATSPLASAALPEEKLSTGAAVVASSTESKPGFDLKAGNVVDGDPASRWSSAFADPQWIQLDLRAVRSVSKVVLKWENAAAKAYQVQISTDAQTWSTVATTTTGDGGIDTITATATARYVRMLGTARTTPYGYSLYEIEVYGTTPATPAPVAVPGNMALGRPVVVTSTEASVNVNAAGANAVDGNPATRWSSAFADPQSITVDLGVVRPITQVVLRWENAAAKAYQVQVSDNGTSYTTAYATTTGDGGTDTITLTSAGRYVRILGTTRTTPYGYSLFEVAVYSVTPTPTPTATPTPAPIPGGAAWSNAWAAPNPLVGQRLWVNPNSNARQEIAKRPNDAAAVAALSKIASRSNALWVGDWFSTATVAATVDAAMDQAASSGSVPILATYALPNRDCGYYSGGGFRSPAAYNEWVRQVALGIGNRKAVVIVEPDSLAVVDCLSTAAMNDRVAMLSAAVTTLRTSGALIYLDAGTSNWVAPATMADRLRRAGVANARGFATNVSNFRLTNDVLTYANAVSTTLGGAKFVVDTSRNGLGDAVGISEPWCNPPGRALGTPPTTSTASAAADAYLWIKTIGQSDGTCNRGNPPAGTWMPDYAIGLAQRAAF